MALRRIGQILVDLGYVSDEQLELLVDEQKQRPDQLFGQVAMDMGLINDDQLAQALAEQMIKRHWHKLLTLGVAMLVVAVGCARSNRQRGAGGNTGDVLDAVAHEIRTYVTRTDFLPKHLSQIDTSRLPYVSHGGIPEDSWGHELILMVDQTNVIIHSLGPDGAFESEDDIVERVSLWELEMTPQQRREKAKRRTRQQAESTVR